MQSLIADQRLDNQGIARARHRRPDDVVRELGAVQAQEYVPAKWALGLRMDERATAARIESAFEAGRILRTHVMRPTWHFVTPADIGWMQELTSPRVQRVMASYNRRLELDAGTLRRAIRVLERVLRDQHYQTRTEIADQLERSGVAARGQRLAHLMMHAELERVVCSGPRRGKQFTYALVAERASRGRRLSRDEALAELTKRYFPSHGPATIRDFVWWSGLTTADAKRGLDMNKARSQVIDGLTYWTLGGSTVVAQPFRAAGRSRAAATPTVHLLPIYDEYLVAYRDRDAVPHASSIISPQSHVPVIFQHALVVAGQVAGTWRTNSNASDVAVEVFPLRG